MPKNPFDKIKGRYIVLLWLGTLVWVPGLSGLDRFLPENAEIYWLDLSYYYYLLFLMPLLALILVVIGNLDFRLMFRIPDKRDIKFPLEITAILFLFSMVSLYAVFYPLSLISPAFVEMRYLDIPPPLYYDSGSVLLIPSLLSFLSQVIFFPVMYEFLFRGLLLHRWRHKWGIKAAILASSVVYGLAFVEPLGSIVFGIGMCVIYLRTGTLWVPIICSMAFSFVGWAIDAGYCVYEGFCRVPTIQSFQQSWPYAALAAIVVFLWATKYLRNRQGTWLGKLPRIVSR